MNTKITDTISDIVLISSNARMTIETKTRSITLPLELWDLLDDDARANDRSSVQQLKNVLATYYGEGTGSRLSASERSVIQQLEALLTDPIIVKLRQKVRDGADLPDEKKAGPRGVEKLPISKEEALMIEDRRNREKY